MLGVDYVIDIMCLVMVFARGVPNTWHMQHLSSPIAAGSPGSSVPPSHLVLSFVTVTWSRRQEKEARSCSLAEFSGNGLEGFLLRGVQKKKKKQIIMEEVVDCE